jgi:hypothetical protein
MQSSSSLLIVFLYFLLPCYLYAHSKDDPILTLSRSQHVKVFSDWNELSLELNPRFLMNKQVIYHTIVPKYNANVSTDFRIDPNFDLKVSFLFDHFQKLSTPWIVVYDSVGRKSLKKLDIVFTHDQYEILKVDFKAKCEMLTPCFPCFPSSHCSFS